MNSSKTLLIILILNLTVAVASIYINYQFFTAIVNAQQAPASIPAASSNTQDEPNIQSDETESNTAHTVNSGEKKASSGLFSPKKTQDYIFHTVEKLIVSVNDEEDVRYFIIDLVLQAPEKTDKKKLSQVEPAVRHALVSYLSDRTYSDIRSASFNQLQADIEKAILDDFKRKRITTPFTQVLVSKLIAQ